MATSSNRITGLASGLDIESIVKASMQTYQNKIDKNKKAKGIAEIKQQLYRDIINDGRDFYNKYCDIAKSGNLISSSSYSSTKFTAVDESVATATGLASAVKDNYTVNVTQKAASAQATFTSAELNTQNLEITSGGKTVLIKQADIAGKTGSELATILSTKLSAIGMKATCSDFKGGSILLQTTGTGSDKSFTINSTASTANVKPADVDGTVTSDNINISAILADKPADGIYSTDMMFGTAGTDAVIIKASTLQSTVSAQTTYLAGDGAGKLKADGAKYLNDLKTSLEQVKNSDTSTTEEKAYADEQLARIGSTVFAAGAAIDSNVTDIFNAEINQRIKSSVQSALKDKGYVVTLSGGELSVKDSEGNPVSYTQGNSRPERIEGGSALVATDYKDGKNLVATVKNSSGDTITYVDSVPEGNTDPNIKASTSNSIVLDGVAFTINGIGTTSVNGKTDVKDLKDKIVNVINDYNTYMTKLNTLLTEKRYRDYSPLTDEQKEEMTDDQIKAWETKVKSGQLKGDSDLSRIQNSLKNAMSNFVSGAGITLESIGITPVSSYATTKDGTFTIDEEKLTSALETKTDEIMKLFTQKGEDASTTGIMYRMKDVLNDEVVSSTKSSLIKKAGIEGTTSFTQSTLSRLISDYEDKIDNLQDWYKDKEQALYSKWAKVESAMNNYNSQTSYLSSMMGSN